MKRLGLAVALACTAIASPAIAEVDRNYPYDVDRVTRQQEREARQQEREARRDEYRRDLRDARRDDEFARVIESRPLYAASDARQQCWNTRSGRFEDVPDSHTRIGKGAAIGAVAGGVLGHQVDSGAGTALGAVLGGVVGHQVERRNDRNDHDDFDMARCHTVGDSGAVQGYEVRYEYRGQEYVTRMDHDPGRRLRLGEDVRWDGSPNDATVSYSTPTYTHPSYGRR